MPVGFGGDAKVALLTGLIGGMNKREENKRTQERQRILNEQAMQQTRESEARVQNYEATAKFREENQQRQQRHENLVQLDQQIAQRAQTRKAAQAEEARLARINAITDAAMNNEQFAGWPRDRVQALIEHSNPADVFDMAVPDTEEDETDKLNRYQLANAIRLEIENDIPRQIARIAEHPAEQRLIQALSEGNMRGVHDARKALLADKFHPEAIEAYIDATGMEQVGDKPKPKAVTQLRDEGAIKAQGDFQQMEALVKAGQEPVDIFDEYIEDAIQQATEGDPLNATYWREVIKEVQRLKQGYLEDVADGKADDKGTRWSPASAVGR